MLNSTSFIARNIHQDHRVFTDASKGRQCSFTSFPALICAQSRPVREWNACTVDQILTEGDRMYLNALERQIIPDTELLSLNCLPDRACWFSPIAVAAESNQSLTDANNPNQSVIAAQSNNQ